MARSNNGWIVLARQLKGHWIWKDKDALSIWLWLLMSANYDESTILWKGKERTLERAQVVTTLREIATECYCNIAKVDRVLKSLKSNKMIETENETHGRIITILNYRKFNDKDDTDETGFEKPFEKRTKNERKTNETIRTKEQENKETNSIPSISNFGLDLGKRWLAFGLKAHPQYVNKWTVEKFGIAIDEVVRRGPFTPEQMEAAFSFIQEDFFWSQNARSPAGLLKKSEKNSLRKIDNILSRIPKKEKTIEELLHEYDQKRGSVCNMA